jgi:hypothetical protein
LRGCRPPRRCSRRSRPTPAAAGARPAQQAQGVVHQLLDVLAFQLQQYCVEQGQGQAPRITEQPHAHLQGPRSGRQDLADLFLDVVAQRAAALAAGGLPREGVLLGPGQHAQQQRALADPQGGKAVQGLQPVERRLEGGHQAVDLLPALLLDAVQDLLVELLFAGEIGVEAAGAHPGAAGDLSMLTRGSRDG